MRRLTTGILFCCFLFMTALTSQAQETIKAKKMEGHTWHQVVMVKFKPGTMDQAQKIITDHFMKAGMESDTPGPQMMHFKTGEWDMMFVWTMDSISDLDWEVHPDDEKWWKAMVKQEGSEEKAMKVWQKYLDMIDRSTSYLATTQDAMAGEKMGSNQ